MSKSPIEWTEHTWNPIVGCSIVSPGCSNCYAMKTAARNEAMGISRYDGTTRKVNGNAVWTGKLAQAPEATLLEPLRRKKPTIYFVNSMGDLFHEDCLDAWIDRVFTIMAMSPQHTFQVLTKRAARMRSYCVKTSRNTINGHIWSMFGTPYGSKIKHNGNWQVNWPLPNVWLGVSTERQQEADERIPLLVETPAAVRFISAEPLLGPIDLTRIPHAHGSGNALEPGEIHGGTGQCIAIRPALDWVIVGGESGPGARPMHPQWARSLRDQCHASGVPMFFKQWGEFGPCDGINVSMQHALCGAMGMAPHIERNWVKALDFFKKAKHATDAAVLVRIGKKAAGRYLDGRLHNAMPEVRA